VQLSQTDRHQEKIPQMNQQNNYVVVMSACIDPSNGSIKVPRNDPSVRLQDYINGLNFWINIPDRRLDKIVFIENSGYPLDALQELARIFNPLNKQIEFISLCCNEYPEGVHYGYAELNMIDEAFGTSKLINECSYLIKATGRLTFPAISRLLDRLPADFMFAVDCRNNSMFTTSAAQIFTTTQLMIFSTSFYKDYLLNAKSQLSKEVGHIEKLFYYKLMKFQGKKGAILRWPVNVDPSGYSSGWYKNYDSLKQKTTNKARAICRILFPNWWV
jgi:hypothetical protein